MSTTPYEEGSNDAPICFIGEAPASDEMRRGRPFVGNAGQLLDRLLHVSGIVRQRCKITNVWEVPVFKKRNDEGKIFNAEGALLWQSTAKGGFTDAGRAAAAGALTRLHSSSANVIVPLGAPAMQLLTNDTRSITKWRGSILASPTLNSRKIVPTIHPSACLKGTYEWRYLIASDLKRARLESASPTIALPQRNLIIDPSFQQILSYLSRFWEWTTRLLAAGQAPFIATDIEVLTGQVSCFSLSYDPLEAISIPLIDADFAPRWTVEEETIIWREYARIIGDPRITKINQNITFDLAALLQLNRIIPRGPVEDPMVAFSIMNPFLSKSLGTICSLCTREPYYKDDGTLEDGAKVEDFQRYWEYNAKDSAIALESWQFLAPMIDADDYRPTYDITINMISSLIAMMVNGLCLNESALHEMRAIVKAKILDVVERMRVAFDRPIVLDVAKGVAQERERKENRSLNPRSPKQLCNYFYVEKKIRPYINAAGGQSVDDENLVRIIRRDKLPEAKLVQEFRTYDKLHGTYLMVGYDRDKRMRCSYNLRGTWTGRLSSSETIFHTGTNQQNLPPEMRTFLESDMVQQLENLS